MASVACVASVAVVASVIRGSWGARGLWGTWGLWDARGLWGAWKAYGFIWLLLVSCISAPPSRRGNPQEKREELKKVQATSKALHAPWPRPARLKTRPSQLHDTTP